MRISMRRHGPYVAQTCLGVDGRQNPARQTLAESSQNQSLPGSVDILATSSKFEIAIGRPRVFLWRQEVRWPKLDSCLLPASPCKSPGRFRRSGTNTEMGPSLSRVFQEAGLLAPSTHTDTLLGSEPWLPECLHSLRPQMAQLGLSLEPLGDFETFSERLQTEVTAFKTTTPLPDLVSAWSRKPVREGVC